MDIATILLLCFVGWMFWIGRDRWMCHNSRDQQMQTVKIQDKIKSPPAS